MTSMPHLPEMPQSEAQWFDALVSLARYLRTPDGCPWDREQTSSDFARYAGEEAAELAEAIEEGDDTHIEEEWGDTLFTLLATLAAAEEEGRFTLRHALEVTHEKMIRRHAHIFGEHEASTPEEVARVWEDVKAREKQGDV